MEPTDDVRSRTVTWHDPMATAAGMEGRSGLEFLRAIAAGEFPPPPILETVGGEFVEFDEGRAVFAFEPAEFQYNPIGSVHGGVYATMLDSACGCAVQTMLPEGVGYTSLDLSVKFLGTIRVGSGRVTATGRVDHLGRRTALASAELRGPDGRLLASATSSCLILRP
ncbi:PaaI family thioesterase [Jatrophihabitans sp. YIM 134969]